MSLVGRAIPLASDPNVQACSRPRGIHPSFVPPPDQHNKLCSATATAGVAAPSPVSLVESGSGSDIPHKRCMYLP